jgi:hypothetical protein
MSYNNFEEYLNQLTQKVKDLKSQIKEVEQEIIQQNLAFGVRQNDLRAEVAASQRGYKPSGIGLSIQTEFDSTVSAQTITSILSSMYKLI